jgi:hypothetical protein
MPVSDEVAHRLMSRSRQFLAKICLFAIPVLHTFRFNPTTNISKERGFL